MRQLIGRLGGGRGHRTFTGTPEQVADTIQDWFERGAADGFNIMPPCCRAGLEAFVDHVVPILRERGLFRTEYTGTTLREHYGLRGPTSQYAAPPSSTPLDQDDRMTAETSTHLPRPRPHRRQGQPADASAP